MSENKEKEDKFRAMLERMALTQQQQEPSTDHKFWSTQPVPRLDEVVTEEGPIEPDMPKDDLRQEPYKLPAGYVWSLIDLNIESEMTDVYALLMGNYVEDDDAAFRFNYKREFLKWGLQPPEYKKE